MDAADKHGARMEYWADAEWGCQGGPEPEPEPEPEPGLELVNPVSTPLCSVCVFFFLLPL